MSKIKTVIYFAFFLLESTIESAQQQGGSRATQRLTQPKKRLNIDLSALRNFDDNSIGHGGEISRHHQQQQPGHLFQLDLSMLREAPSRLRNNQYWNSNYNYDIRDESLYDDYNRINHGQPVLEQTEDNRVPEMVNDISSSLQRPGSVGSTGPEANSKLYSLSTGNDALSDFLNSLHDDYGYNGFDGEMENKSPLAGKRNPLIFKPHQRTSTTTVGKNDLPNSILTTIRKRAVELSSDARQKRCEAEKKRLKDKHLSINKNQLDLLKSVYLLQKCSGKPM